MFEKARWIRDIGAMDEEPARMFRNDIVLKDDVKSAEMFVLGLGYGIYYVNGIEVTDDVLTTQITAYDKKALYNRYDITDKLKKGGNGIGAVIGNGWYNQQIVTPWHFECASWRYVPTLVMQIEVEYKNGECETFMTDTSWRVCAEGPWLYNNVRSGEMYDARREIDGWNLFGFECDDKWKMVMPAKAPGGRLGENIYPNVKIIRTLEPTGVNKISKNRTVYDFGENLSGWGMIKIRGNSGTKIRIIYAERLNDDGSVDQKSINAHLTDAKLKNEDVYILKGEGEEVFHPVFNFHGFRYICIETEGKPERLECLAQLIHTDIKSVGSFECSDEMLNKIHLATRRSTLTNFVSIPMDCPHREQNGWTGDAYYSAQQAIMNFDMAKAYEKWLGDVRDGQRNNGQIAAIAPSPTFFGYTACGGAVWDAALFMIPYQVYEYTGDMTLIAQNIDAMEKNIRFLETLTDNYIMGEGIGDWTVPEGIDLPWPHYVALTAFWYMDIVTVAKCCDLTGRDSTYYRALAKNTRDAFRKKFVKTDCIGMGEQIDYAVAIYCGLLNPDEEKSAADKLAQLVIDRGYHIGGGTSCIKAIFTALSKYNYDDVLYKMVTNPTYPSYAYWILNGVTTLCESWRMGSSLNHHMYSEVDHWFYRYLGGIQLSPDGLVIEPHFIGLKHLKAMHKEIAVEYDEKTIRIKSPIDFTLVLYGKKYHCHKGWHTFELNGHKEEQATLNL